MNINQLKLEVHDSLKKDENLTTNFEPTDNTDVINKGYPDEKVLKRNCHISYLKMITMNLNYNTTNNL